MKLIPTELPGVFQLQPETKADERGRFTKTMQRSFLERHGLETTYQEIYHSVSKTNILRGMHFQVPPADGAKIVCCLDGLVQDALLDLRVGSSTYGHHIVVPLRAEQTNMLYMPAGIAHGFWVEQGPATLLYYEHAEYALEQDKGIAWNKAGIKWPCQAPIISARDAGFPGLNDFSSPFIFDALFATRIADVSPADRVILDTVMAGDLAFTRRLLDEDKRISEKVHRGLANAPGEMAGCLMPGERLVGKLQQYWLEVMRRRAK